MGLFTPIWMMENPNDMQRDQAMKTAETLTGQELIQAATEAPVGMIRAAAVKNPNLTDQAVLAEIARKDRDEWVRRDAAEKLTDQAVLTEIVRDDGSEWVRCAAAEKLTDQGVLTEIALKDKDYDVRRAAAEKLTDQAVLEEIALKDPAQLVRKAAAEKVTGWAALAKIAAREKDEPFMPEIRITALRKLALLGDAGAVESLCACLGEEHDKEKQFLVASALREVYRETVSSEAKARIRSLNGFYGYRKHEDTCSRGLRRSRLIDPICLDVD